MSRRLAVAGVTLGLLAAGGGVALAGATSHSAIVATNPADWTPNFVDGQVNKVVQIGGRLLVGGSFTQVRNAGTSTVIARRYLLAIDARTGKVDPRFDAKLDGPVNALSAAADGASVYVGGAFKTVGGVASRGVTRVAASTGSRFAAFVPPVMSGQVNDLQLVGSRLIIGGSFARLGSLARPALAALNPVSAAVDGSVALTLAGPRSTIDATAPLKVEALDVSADGRRMVIIGNFSTVNHFTRHQLAVVDLGTTATLSSWSTDSYRAACRTNFPSYVRNVDIAPDGRWFVVVTSGGKAGPTCDAATRFDFGTPGPNKAPTWINSTGGDTLLSVSITGPAVYVGGHQRWLNMPPVGSTGAVSREGIGAINPSTGKALSWNPSKERGFGTTELYPTSAGLWVGSDTDRVAGEFHQKLAFFPLP